MGTKEGAEKACKEPNPIIDGRKANVNLAVLGAKPRVNSLQGKIHIKQDCLGSVSRTSQVWMLRIVVLVWFFFIQSSSPFPAK